MKTIDRHVTVRFSRSVSGRRGKAASLNALLRGVGSALGWLEDRLEKRRSRLSLDDLTDSQLKDIGISRADAYREACRSFWD